MGILKEHLKSLETGYCASNSPTFKDVALESSRSKNKEFFEIFEIKYWVIAFMYSTISDLDIDEYMNKIDFLPSPMYEDLRDFLMKLLKYSKFNIDVAVKNKLLLRAMSAISDEDADILDLRILRDQAKKLI